MNTEANSLLESKEANNSNSWPELTSTDSSSVSSDQEYIEINNEINKLIEESENKGKY
jgi:hypothetical protein